MGASLREFRGDRLQSLLFNSTKYDEYSARLVTRANGDYLPRVWLDTRVVLCWEGWVFRVDSEDVAGAVIVRGRG